MAIADTTTKIQLRLPKTLKADIDAYAKHMRQPSSYIIRLAITQFLDLPADRAKFVIPKPKAFYQASANTRRKQAAAALRYLAQHEPEKLLAILAQQQQKKVAS